jgi:outer membrane immunogenic protein
MSNNRAILIALAGLSFAPPALAADLGPWTPKQPASIKDEPVYEQRTRWDGFYLGVNGGYAWADTNNAPLFFNGDYQGGLGSLSPEGGFGGGQIGYNVTYGRVLLGLEADVQAADINDRSFGAVANGGASTDIDWFGTVRGRAGFVMDRALIYVTGGYAWADADMSFRAFGPDSGKISDSETLNGYVLGGGIEWALTDKWSTKLEYQYVDLEDTHLTGFVGGNRYDTRIDPDFHTVRLGLNYRF